MAEFTWFGNDEYDPNAEDYFYKAAFLNAGNYTITLTCQAAEDEPETDDEIDFTETANVSVEAGSETIHDFMQ